jgi:putative polyhydroxyalkanoate system protein
MADIDFTQPYSMPHQDARAAAQLMADKMASEFSMDTTWEGDVLRFERSGLTGTLALRDQAAHLEMQLGMMLKAFAPAIQDKVVRNMKKLFGAPTD